MPLTAQSITIKHIVSKCNIFVFVFQYGPVFAPHWSARLVIGYSKARMASAQARTASEGAPSESLGVHVHVRAGSCYTGQKIARTHREPGERM